MTERILIFGRKGWLAQRFNEFFENSEISNVNITDLEAVREELDEKKPDVVINAAGKTSGSNVKQGTSNTIDWCEENITKTMDSNFNGPKILFKACEERKIYWVHLGSGCIFQGNGLNGKGFTEKNRATPPSWYSWTKFWADKFLKDKPVLILRLRMPIDNKPHPRNLIDKLKKYSELIDPQNSITVIPDFLEAAKKLIEKKRTGIYHVVNPGTISPAEIMILYGEVINRKYQEFKTISEEELYEKGRVKAKRSNCILNTEKLKREGIHLEPVRKRVLEILMEYKKNLGPGL